MFQYLRKNCADFTFADYSGTVTVYTGANGERRAY